MRRFFQPRFALAFLRGLVLKIKCGSGLKFNPFKVYFSKGASIILLEGGSVVIDGATDRVFLSEQCEIIVFGGRVTIGSGVFFNRRCTLICRGSITIGKDTMFGPNVVVVDHDHIFADPSVSFRTQGYITKPVSIGDNVWIGANSVVLKGASIGRSVVVGANAVAKGILTECSVYAGNPLKLIKTISAQTTIHPGNA